MVTSDGSKVMALRYIRVDDDVRVRITLKGQVMQKGVEKGVLKNCPFSKTIPPASVRQQHVSPQLPDNPKSHQRNMKSIRAI